MLALPEKALIDLAGHSFRAARKWIFIIHAVAGAAVTALILLWMP